MSQAGRPASTVKASATKAAGIASAPPKKKAAAKKKAASPKYGGLNKQQTQVINQTNKNDIALGDAAGGLMGQIGDAYGQPFDYSKLPQSPWEQGQSIEDMNQEYYNRALSNYDRSMNDQYKQQDEDFEQQMSNRGIPMGSELYNKMRAETQKIRDSSRQNAMDSAYFNAGQNATTWNNLGTQNFQNAYGFEQDKRNQPLADYSRLTAAQSGMQNQNLQYSQQRGLNEQEGQIARSMPRGGGGGGGGGGGVWQKYGFATPQEYDAYRVQQQRDQSQWEWANNPQYKQGKGPNPWAQVGGQVLGIGAGILGSKYI